MTCKNQTLSIGAQIRRAEGELFDLLAAVEDKRKYIEQLKGQRDGCNHQWAPFLMGREHEGKTCIRCGINSLEANLSVWG
jgi:hypothetical protein